MFDCERLQDKRAYFQTIREAGMKDESEEFRRLHELREMKQQPGGRLPK
jgi:hypothetical protein